MLAYVIKGVMGVVGKFLDFTPQKLPPETI